MTHPRDSQEAAYERGRGLLDDVLPDIDKAIQSGRSIADVVVGVGGDLAMLGIRDPFSLATVAAVALVEVYRLRQDLAAVEDVAAEARTHWPVDQPEIDGLSDRLKAEAHDAEVTARGREQVDAQAVWTDVAPGRRAARFAGAFDLTDMTSVAAGMPWASHAIRGAAALDISIGKAHAAGDHSQCDREQCPNADPPGAGRG
jgi:hypothetical protein